MSVKQQIWRLNASSFESELEPVCGELLGPKDAVVVR
jgi:hypothetical protein